MLQLSVLLLLAVSISAEPTSMNILLITADDLGHQLGVYGDTQARTPEMDRLAEEGVRFQNAYITHASCSPSRSSMLTGMYPHENGQIGLSHVGYALKEGVPLLPNLLRDAGYRTGVMGKVHVEPFEWFEWDEYIGKSVNTRDVAAMRDRAVQFIRESGDQPFFLMVNYSDPHRPMPDQVKGIPENPVGPQEIEPFPFLAGADSPGVRKEVAGFYNSVARLDVGIGMMLSALQDMGKAENTVVVLLGDHGPPFTRAKTTCYEAGIRVPLLIRFPDGAYSGDVNNELVSSIDLAPTLLELAGASVPVGMTGTSLMPLLREPDTVSWRKVLGAEYTGHHGAGGYYPRRSVRKGRYKLIFTLLEDQPNPITAVDGCSAWAASREPRFDGTLTREVMNRHHQPSEFELYDLGEDPYEFDNLADRPEFAEVLKEMKNALRQWQEETSDPLLNPEAVRSMNQRHREWEKKRIRVR